jgi:hypothetical protein
MKKIFITGSGGGLGRIYGITGVVTAVLLRVATEPKHRAAALPGPPERPSCRPRSRKEMLQ